MNKSKLNFIIYIFMFICMMLIASIGFLIKFTLIPGRESWEIYGKNVDLFLFGMDRHQWGTIHLYIGFVLLGLLILHIYLHWKTIVGLYRKLITSAKIRNINLWILMVVFVFLMVFPFVVNPKVVERVAGKDQQSVLKVQEDGMEPTMKQSINKLQNNFHEKNTPSDIAIEVRGYMTLTDVAQRHNVPVNIILDRLGIPKSALNVNKLGRLRKMYGFEMTEIEKIVYKYSKSHSMKRLR